MLCSPFCWGAAAVFDAVPLAELFLLMVVVGDGDMSWPPPQSWPPLPPQPLLRYRRCEMEPHHPWLISYNICPYPCRCSGPMPATGAGTKPARCGACCCSAAVISRARWARFACYGALRCSLHARARAESTLAATCCPSHLAVRSYFYNPSTAEQIAALGNIESQRPPPRQRKWLSLQ